MRTTLIHVGQHLKTIGRLKTSLSFKNSKISEYPTYKLQCLRVVLVINCTVIDINDPQNYADYITLGY